jgi:SAM-dependent methyltransferase
MQVTRFNRDTGGRTGGAVLTYNSIWRGTVVDVGCRGKELEAALAGRPISYVGVDIDPSADIVADLGEKLPFDDDWADVVVALDVLEHTNDIHHAFSELCRVASRHVVITLPNCYEAGIRMRFLRGGPVSDKYGLPLDPPEDRHRWFFSFAEAGAFVQSSADREGWRVLDERAVVFGYRRLFPGIVGRWPNLLSPTYLALLGPK